MPNESFVDYYELLQLDPGAEPETIELVSRHLARRFHPDSATGGDREKFQNVVTAHDVLTDPTRRAEYDVAYHQARVPPHAPADAPADDASAAAALEADRRLRKRILVRLYQARRGAGKSGIGDYQLEQGAGCGADELAFHLWYMSAKGWIVRTDDGHLTITVAGVDQLS